MNVGKNLSREAVCTIIDKVKQIIEQTNPITSPANYINDKKKDMLIED